MARGLSIFPVLLEQTNDLGYLVGLLALVEICHEGTGAQLPDQPVARQRVAAPTVPAVEHHQQRVQRVEQPVVVQALHFCTITTFLTNVNSTLNVYSCLRIPGTVFDKKTGIFPFK